MNHSLRGEDGRGQSVGVWGSRGAGGAARGPGVGGGVEVGLAAAWRLVVQLGGVGAAHGARTLAASRARP